MMSREEAEAAIRHLLATETDSVRVSNWLFRPPPFGLFSKLWSTQEEKRAVMASPLFQEAQQRVTELMRQEVAELQQRDAARSRPPVQPVVPAAPPPSRADEPAPAEAKP
ncbi:MAG: hypothetical protein K2X82_16510 [Gemmataceae bacterium]|nr:hypothetical protein [Gemmataceae bacterium]